MRIGTVRPEEAKGFDSFAGDHRFHTEEAQEAHGSLDVFWVDAHTGSCASDPPQDAGWYWWACAPGCLPDGEACGPFATSREALLDADEWNPEFDADFA